jgi:hypothetical protein
MKKTITPLALCALLAACATTPESRIARNPALFDSLGVAEQAQIRAGRVQPGFTPDMVLLALGKPHRTLSRTTPQGQTLVWLYFAPDAVPVRSRVLFDAPAHSTSSAWVTIQQPDPVPRVRVEFLDGTVSAVETATSDAP